MVHRKSLFKKILLLLINLFLLTNTVVFSEDNTTNHQNAKENKIEQVPQDSFPISQKAEEIGEIDFSILKTEDTFSLSQITLADKVNYRYKMLEITYPESLQIDNYQKPSSYWREFENASENGYESLVFAMDRDNTLSNIKKTLESLRFKQKGSEKKEVEQIKVHLRGNVYTSWIDIYGKIHYYEFIEITDKTDATYNWFDAYNDAKKRSMSGYRGYLATLTSKEEQRWVYDKIAKNSGYLGGTRIRFKNGSLIDNQTELIARTPTGGYLESDLSDVYNFESLATYWYWATGPESGEAFYNRKEYTNKTPAKDAPSKIGFDWFNNKDNNKKDRVLSEPNNSGGGGRFNEQVLQFAQPNINNASVEFWNDVSYRRFNDSKVEGYYVEYSDFPGNRVEETTPPPEDSREVETHKIADIPKTVNIGHYSKTTPTKSLSPIVTYHLPFRIGDIINTSSLGKQITHYTNSGQTLPQQPTGSNKIQEVKILYQPITYNITYQSNDATNQTVKQAYTVENEAITLKNNTTFKRTGYKIIGWNTKADGTGTSYGLSSKINGKNLAQNITLYAQWQTDNVNITFHHKLLTASKTYEDIFDFSKNPPAKVTQKTNSYPVGQSLATILKSINTNYSNYNHHSNLTKVKINGTEVTPHPSVVPANNLEITYVYTGALNLNAAKELVFQASHFNNGTTKQIALTTPTTLNVINTMGSNSQWELRAKLSQEMESTKKQQKLLGDIYYLSNHSTPKVTLNSDFKKIEQSSTENVLQKNYPLKGTNQGLFLELHSGNLADTYEKGSITWELKDRITIK
ncbi:InlB B-repeat-containing protein [Vagococcus sp.]|uniref:InlB B-repeat-containing protein n=1 Tax=Vagococcus sp. TaxID=1933889 RepID=UPI003F96A454